MPFVISLIFKDRMNASFSYSSSIHLYSNHPIDEKIIPIIIKLKIIFKFLILSIFWIEYNEITVNNGNKIYKYRVSWKSLEYT